MLAQRARHFFHGFWFETLCRAFFEVSLLDGPKGYGGLRACLGLLKLRVVAEVHRGERALSPLACFVGVERLDSPERHSALLRPRRDIGRSSSLAAVTRANATYAPLATPRRELHRRAALRPMRHKISWQRRLDCPK